MVKLLLKSYMSLNGNKMGALDYHNLRICCESCRISVEEKVIP